MTFELPAEILYRPCGFLRQLFVRSLFGIKAAASI